MLQAQLPPISPAVVSNRGPKYDCHCCLHDIYDI